MEEQLQNTRVTVVLVKDGEKGSIVRYEVVITLPGGTLIKSSCLVPDSLSRTIMCMLYDHVPSSVAERVADSVSNQVDCTISK
ncbi:MAG: hypothetical protein ACOCXQ_04030 [Patescibacteria group bacterium]